LEFYGGFFRKDSWKRFYDESTNNPYWYRQKDKFFKELTTWDSPYIVLDSMIKYGLESIDENSVESY
jgi:hypothetical protein